MDGFAKVTVEQTCIRRALGQAPKSETLQEAMLQMRSGADHRFNNSHAEEGGAFDGCDQTSSSSLR